METNKIKLSIEELNTMSSNELLELYKEIDSFLLYLENSVLPLDEDDNNE